MERADVPVADRRMREFWDEAARTNAVWYVDTTQPYDDPDMARFLRAARGVVATAIDESPVPLPGNALAVEIGAGLGRMCAALAQRFEQVVGVDVSPEMVAKARASVPDERIDFRLGDGATLPGVADGTADLVFSYTVFQHIPDPRIIDAYLREAARVLRPGGVLVFQWNNIPWAWGWRIRAVVLTFLQRTGLRPETHGRHAPAFLGSRIPRRRIERVLDRAGLEVVAVHGQGTLWAWMWARKR